MFAVDEGHKDIVQRLVFAGADVHIRNKVCGDMESVWQMLHVASSKWVRENRLYNSIHVCDPCAQMMYCAQFREPDHFSRIAHVHEERGEGRERKDIKCGS